VIRTGGIMFFQVSIDKASKEYWYLSNLKDTNNNDIDEFDFKRGKLFSKESELYYEITKKGAATDLTFAGVFIPVISKSLKEEITSLTEDCVQFIPVNIKNQKEKYYIINTLKIIDCIDMEKSGYMKINKPSLPKYSFYKLIIDELKVPVDIFRLKNWESALIISNKIKIIFEKHNMDGIIFRKVTL
jgi:hypothetical protein